MSLDHSSAQAIRDLAARTTISVEEAGKLCGLGRVHAYREAHRYLDTNGAEGLPTLRWGRKLVCPTAKVLALLGLAPVLADTTDPGQVVELERRREASRRDSS